MPKYLISAWHDGNYEEGYSFILLPGVFRP